MMGRRTSTRLKSEHVDTPLLCNGVGWGSGEGELKAYINMALRGSRKEMCVCIG